MRLQGEGRWKAGPQGERDPDSGGTHSPLRSTPATVTAGDQRVAGWEPRPEALKADPGDAI